MKLARKFLTYVMAVAFLIVGGVIFSACDETKLALTSNMVSLGYTAATYDGTAKMPAVTVTVDGVAVESDQYTVEYSNNVAVGTGIVKVTASEESEIITGTVSVGFEIVKAQKTATTFDGIKSAIGDANYSSVSVSENLTIPAGETLIIPQGFTVDFEDKVLTIAGKLVNNGTIVLTKPISGAGEIQNNGEIIAEVKTFVELNAAFSYANKVVLVDNIGLPTALDLQTELYTCTNAKYEEITIDLNGKKLQRVVRFDSSYKVRKITLTSTNGVGEINVDGMHIKDCALFVKGSATEYKPFNLFVDNIKMVGTSSVLQTNGNYASQYFTMNFKNCVFEGKDTAGTYLPANYNYNFDNCSFVGLTAYYTKSGNHTLNNCVLTANMAEYNQPQYDGSGCYITGSGLVLDSSRNYSQPLFVTIDGGEISSAAGYAVEEYTTSNGELQNFYSTLNIKNSPAMVSGAGKVQMFVPTFKESLELSNVNTMVGQMFDKLGNKDVLLENKTYTVEEVEEKIDGLKLYVKLGTIKNLVSLDQLQMGETIITKNEVVTINIPNGNKIIDRAFYVNNDGEIYVLAVVVQQAGNAQKEFRINGKTFEVDFGKGLRQLEVTDVTFGGGHNTIQRNPLAYNTFDATISSLTAEDSLSVSCLNCAEDDKIISMVEIAGSKTFSILNYGDGNVTENILGVYDDFFDVDRAYDGETAKYTLYVQNKGITTIYINIDLLVAV